MNDNLILADSTVSTRLWSRVNIDPLHCWEWLGCTNEKGYGLIKVGGKRGVAGKVHRIAWVLKFGSTHGLQVLHHCDNRRCVRPDHLFLGTHQDNMRDMDCKGR